LVEANLEELLWVSRERFGKARSPLPLWSSAHGREFLMWRIVSCGFPRPWCAACRTSSSVLYPRVRGFTASLVLPGHAPVFIRARRRHDELAVGQLEPPAPTVFGKSVGVESAADGLAASGRSVGPSAAARTCVLAPCGNHGDRQATCRSSAC